MDKRGKHPERFQKPDGSKFVTVGDNCIDWYFQQGEMHVGGCAVNVSVYLSQLGKDSAYLGAVGKDENGALVRTELENHGVDVSHLHALEGNTAVTKIELVDHDRVFCGYEEGVLAEKYIDEGDLNFIRSRDYMHTSVYGNCQEILEKIAEDTVIIYDFAYKIDHETVPFVLSQIHYGFFSYDQDDRFIRDYLKKCWDTGGERLRLLIATLGAKGSLSYDGKEYYRCQIIPVKPIDTMGAGDSFIAGFAGALSEGCDYQECMEAGSMNAAKTVMRRGSF